MPLGDFVAAGTLPKPLPIGRTARLLAGAGALFYFVWSITQVSNRVSSDVLPVGSFIGVAFAWWYFSDLVVVGLSRPWGRWPQVAVLPLALALVVADLVAYGGGWGPPLGWGLFVFVQFFYGYIGISFLLAATYAVPG